MIIELRARTDQLQASLNRIDGQMANLGQQAQRTEGAIGASFTRTALKIGAVTVAVTAAKRGFDQMVQSGREMQALEARFNALTGSASRSQEALAYINETAQRQSIDVLQLADSYARLLPAVSPARSTWRKCAASSS